ncbi:hypothetical protein [Sinomonas atrocyanea]|uniref:hypothetical protein n=1 Tax=Sinomonas atrocyanea TaxID=37927 RepID=UPI00278A841A|nr:hypothetical protein [Sinomonas atrocyanea]MDQ0261391.1 hypothetical protein [Sinomonas atrocyanea]MDR6623554.1 hypothetical protein [Sinomonas atrocyanea]
MGEIIAAAAHLVLRVGDRFALLGGTEERTGTVLAIEAAACVRFRDDLTGQDLLADLAHWESVRTCSRAAGQPVPRSVPAPLPPGASSRTW